MTKSKASKVKNGASKFTNETFQEKSLPLKKNDESSTDSPKPELLAAQPFSKKWANWWTRFIWTQVLIFTFIAILLAGPIPLITLVFGVQVAVYHEIVNLATIPSAERSLPFLRATNLYLLFILSFLTYFRYFLLVTNYFLYGESVIHHFKDSIFANAFLLNVANHHRFYSFLFYCFGFVWFVINLKKGHYKFQFAMFATTHMTLLLVVFTSHFTVTNIFEGMFWFVLPTTLVVVNDIAAYTAGFFFGRTPLIELSPKKTWEGFAGGLLGTIIVGVVGSHFLANFNYMICPIRSLTTTALSNIECIPNPVFEYFSITLPPSAIAFIQIFFRVTLKEIFIRPIIFHGFMMAVFASIIAPFGGFFASGFKRAFELKDFANLIPGHGGLTDRFDCQFLMGLFSYMYYSSFVKIHHLEVGNVLQSIVNNMGADQQLILYQQLKTYLDGQNLL